MNIAAALMSVAFLFGLAGQEKDPPKPEPITAKNIEKGRVGTCENLKVERVLNPAKNLIIARFDGLKVLLIGYPARGIGKGKVLPADQVWRVGNVIESDGSDGGLMGCYILVPERPIKR